MRQGFGIAALVIAIVSIFAFYGFNFALIWIAMLCAALAAASGDKAFTIASAAIALVGLVVLSPVTMAAVVVDRHNGNWLGVIFAFGPFALPVLGLIWGAANSSDEDDGPSYALPPSQSIRVAAVGQRFCPACGAGNTPEANFCTGCGGRVVREEQPAPIAEVPLTQALSGNRSPLASIAHESLVAPARSEDASDGIVGRWQSLPIEARIGAAALALVLCLGSAALWLWHGTGESVPAATVAAAPSSTPPEPTAQPRIAVTEPTSAPDAAEQQAAIAVFLSYVVARAPTMSLAVSRVADFAPGTATFCKAAQYRPDYASERSASGADAWIAWAIRNGILEYRSVLPDDAVQCAVLAEDGLRTDPRVSWHTEDEDALHVRLVAVGTARLVSYRRYLSEYAGRSGVPTFDITLDIPDEPEWSGMTVTPSAVRATAHLARDPQSGRIEVVQASVPEPVVSLVE